MVIWNPSTLDIPGDVLSAKVNELHAWTNRWSAGDVYLYAITFKGNFQCLGYASTEQSATHDYNYNTKTFHAVEGDFAKVLIAKITQDSGIPVLA